MSAKYQPTPPCGSRAVVRRRQKAVSPTAGQHTPDCSLSCNNGNGRQALWIRSHTNSQRRGRKKPGNGSVLSAAVRLYRNRHQHPADCTEMGVKHQLSTSTLDALRAGLRRTITRPAYYISLHMGVWYPRPSFPSHSPLCTSLQHEWKLTFELCDGHNISSVSCRK